MEHSMGFREKSCNFGEKSGNFGEKSSINIGAVVREADGARTVLWCGRRTGRGRCCGAGG